ncbi:MAG TPA: four helix bundle protein [Verrucomicrobiae bacterium]
MTRTFPADEKFGLVSQMRRAAVSVPSNLAEGQARKTTGEFLLFISHAQGSLAELDTQVLLSAELGFIPLNSSKTLSSRIFELQKMLTSLRAKLNAKHRSPTTDP